MKTKLSILFLLMFSMNISCLKEGPYISFRSKLKRLTYYNKDNPHCYWVIDKFFRDGEDVSAEVKSTDTLRFGIGFYGGWEYRDYDNYLGGDIYYPSWEEVKSIVARDPYFCRRNHCSVGADHKYKFIDKGRKIQFKFEYFGKTPTTQLSDTLNTNVYRIGYEKVDNTVQQQILIFDVLRLTHRELVLGWAYRGKYYRMEFIKKPKIIPKCC